MRSWLLFQICFFISNMVIADGGPQSVSSSLFEVKCNQNKLLVKSEHFQLDTEYLFNSHSDCLRQLISAISLQEEGKEISISLYRVKKNIQQESEVKWSWRKKRMCRTHTIGEIYERDVVKNTYTQETRVEFYDFFESELSILDIRDAEEILTQSERWTRNVRCDCKDSTLRTCWIRSRGSLSYN